MESLGKTTGIWPNFSFEFKLDCLNIWTGELQKWPWIGNDANDWPKRRKMRQNYAKFSKTTQNFKNDANTRDLSLNCPRLSMSDIYIYIYKAIPPCMILVPTCCQSVLLPYKASGVSDSKALSLNRCNRTITLFLKGLFTNFEYITFFSCPTERNIFYKRFILDKTTLTRNNWEKRLHKVSPCYIYIIYIIVLGRTDFVHPFFSIISSQSGFIEMDLLQKIFFLVGHEKNVIYSKLVNNPFN